MSDRHAVSPVFGASLLLGMMILAAGLLAAFWVPAVVHDQEAAGCQRAQAAVFDLADRIGTLSGTDGSSGGSGAFSRPPFFWSLDQAPPPDAALQMIFPGLRPSSLPACRVSADEQAFPITFSVYGYIPDGDSAENESAETKKETKESDESVGGDQTMRWHNGTIGRGALTFSFDYVRFPDAVYRIDSLSAVFLTQPDGTVLLSPPVFSSLPPGNEPGLTRRPTVVLSAVEYRSPQPPVYGRDVSARLSASPSLSSFFTAEKLVLTTPVREIAGTDVRKSGPSAFWPGGQPSRKKEAELPDQYAGLIDREQFSVAAGADGSVVIESRTGSFFDVYLCRTVVRVDWN